MSITVTTDVFCDGDDCQNWCFGVTGPSVDRPGARASAGRCGWTHVKGRDLCPSCSAERPTSATPATRGRSSQPDGAEA